MKVEVEIPKDDKKDTVDWQYVQKNSGVYRPISFDTCRIISIDGMTIFVEKKGDFTSRIEQASEFAWGNREFYKTDENIKLVIS